VIKYFAMPAGSNIKKRAARNEEELRREQPVQRVQAREQQQIRVASKGE
jgi:P pilus assembly chaperone PapD